ncbi:GDP-mannose 4,6-dehydratase [Patescibacteria group bacterium]|nr:GDP-mannose 4,6-dehydratase [Patescibacteria group bacterium]
MKVLITGAAGFIGSYLARSLLWKGVDVVGIDNFYEYYPRKCKEFNIDLVFYASGENAKYFPDNTVTPVYEKLSSYYAESRNPQKGKFQFFELDIVDYDNLLVLFRKYNFDAVLHIAAMAGVPLSTKNPRLYTSVNVDGTANLLNCSRETGVKKFVFASSSSVYGNREDRKVVETDNVIKAVSPYGATKVAGEALCHAFSAIYDIDVVIDRIFGPIYGPLQRPYGMFMQRVINYIHNDKTIQIYGKHGLDTAKDSTYIDDQVDGILKCLFYKTKFDIFNIGTSDPKSIRHWIECAEEALGKKASIEIIASDKADVVSSANIDKAKELLEYSPKFNIEEGAKRQVEIFKLMPAWYKSLSSV